VEMQEGTATRTEDKLGGSHGGAVGGGLLGVGTVERCNGRQAGTTRWVRMTR
jgi:hypothetical protein